MSKGIITYISEDGNTIQVKESGSGEIYYAQLTSSDSVKVGNVVEIVDLNNERITQNANKGPLRLLPTSGGYQYHPVTVWYNPETLSAAGNYFSLIKSYLFFTTWQKNCPLYRLGTIAKIIDNKYADVDIDKSWGMGKYRKRCRVDYMTCDTGAFKVNDEIIVSFINSDYRRGVVVGFWRDPKPCDEFLSVVISAPTIGPAVYGFIWDTVNNKYAFVPSSADPNVQVNFPCAYGEISAFIDRYPNGTKDEFTWTSSSIKHKVQDTEIGIGYESFENFVSGDCNPLPNSNVGDFDWYNHYIVLEDTWANKGNCVHHYSEPSNFDPSYTDVEDLDVDRNINTLPGLVYDVITEVDGYAKTYGIRHWGGGLFFPSGTLSYGNFIAKINTTETYDHHEYMHDWLPDIEDAEYQSNHVADSTRRYETDTNFGGFFVKDFTYDLHATEDDMFKEATFPRYMPNLFAFKSASFFVYAYICQGWSLHGIQNYGEYTETWTNIDVDVFVQAALYQNEVDESNNPINPFSYGINTDFTNALKECITRIIAERTSTPNTGPGSLEIDTKILSGKPSGSFSSNSSSSRSISSSSLSRSSSSLSKSSSKSVSKSSRLSVSSRSSSMSVWKIPGGSSSSSSPSSSSLSAV